MKIFTPTSLWYYCLYTLKWNVGKFYKNNNFTNNKFYII